MLFRSGLIAALGGNHVGELLRDVRAGGLQPAVLDGVAPAAHDGLIRAGGDSGSTCTGNFLVGQVFVLQNTAQAGHTDLTSAAQSLVVGAVDVGHAAGAVHIGHRHIAYNYSVVVVINAGDTAVLADAQGVQLDTLVLSVCNDTGGSIVPCIRICRRSSIVLDIRTVKGIRSICRRIVVGIIVVGIRLA